MSISSKMKHTKILIHVQFFERYNTIKTISREFTFEKQKSIESKGG